jgi:hypothetical protein
LPGETFRVLKEEEKQYDEYRTRHWILGYEETL